MGLGLGFRVWVSVRVWVWVRANIIELSGRRTKPIEAVTNIQFTHITTTSMALNWTRKVGDRDKVRVRARVRVRVREGWAWAGLGQPQP